MGCVKDHGSTSYRTLLFFGQMRSSTISPTDNAGCAEAEMNNFLNHPCVYTFNKIVVFYPSSALP